MTWRRWTKEDEAYLQDKWGTISVPAIAKNLGRSVHAIKVRAARLQLGPALMGGDYITLNQLLFAFNGTNAGGNYKLKSWVKNRGLPVHTKKSHKQQLPDRLPGRVLGMGRKESLISGLFQDGTTGSR